NYLLTCKEEWVRRHDPVKPDSDAHHAGVEALSPYSTRPGWRGWPDPGGPGRGRRTGSWRPARRGGTRGGTPGGPPRAAGRSAICRSWCREARASVMDTAREMTAMTTALMAVMSLTFIALPILDPGTGCAAAADASARWPPGHVRGGRLLSRQRRLML